MLYGAWRNAVVDSFVWRPAGVCIGGGLLTHGGRHCASHGPRCVVPSSAAIERHAIHFRFDRPGHLGVLKRITRLRWATGSVTVRGAVATRAARRLRHIVAVLGTPLHLSQGCASAHRLIGNGPRGNGAVLLSTACCARAHFSPLPRLHQALGSPLHQDWGSPLPHLHAGLGLAVATSAPGLGSPLPTSAPGLGSL